MKKFGINIDGRTGGPIDPARVTDDGWTWHDTPRPTPYHVWQDGAWVEDGDAKAASDAEAARLQSISDDAERQALRAKLDGATSEQIDAYVEANVTNLASARTLLKQMLKLMAAP